MEFVKAMKTRDRMCAYIKANTPDCHDCGLSSHNTGIIDFCYNFIERYPEKAEKILEQWDKEHPLKTRKDDFYEKHPNAPKSIRFLGCPNLCTMQCGYTDRCIQVAGNRDIACIECWNQPMEDN